MFDAFPLVTEWLDRYYGDWHLEEGQTEMTIDDNHLYLQCTIDLDYQMGYLLRVVDRNIAGADTNYLAAFVRHGRPHTRDDIDLAWWDEPHEFFNGPSLSVVHHWFVNFTFEPERDDEHGWVERRNAEVEADAARKVEYEAFLAEMNRARKENG